MEGPSPLNGMITESKTNAPSAVKSLIQRNVDGQIRTDSQKQQVLEDKFSGRGIDIIG